MAMVSLLETDKLSLKKKRPTWWFEYTKSFITIWHMSQCLENWQLKNVIDMINPSDSAGYYLSVWAPCASPPRHGLLNSG